VILNEGYAAVTARRIAERAGIKFQLIYYYYFNSLDDLLLEVFQRGTEQNLERLQAALESEQPLRALWVHSTAGPDNRFVIEFMAMALHHETIRVAIAAHAERLRELQVEAISRHLKARGMEPQIPPVLSSFLIASLSRSLLLESALGMTSGHPEMEALVEECLQRFDSPAQ
jgi:AcrR family transcriptional regulator